MSVMETERLTLRRLELGDAAVILELLNDSAFLRFVGDKGVRTEADARQYLLSGPLASYERFGFGLWLIELKPHQLPVGLCGLLQRDTLADVDLGFALLPQDRSQGFASESAAAVMLYARTGLGLKRIVAIADPDNRASIRVLEKVGLNFERTIRLVEDEPGINLHASGVETGHPDIAGRGTYMHFLLFYDVVDDYTVRRQPFRSAHLKYARPFVERGELVLGGALADPPDGAVLLFRGETAEVANSFAAADPYVRHGLVTRWRVRPWTTVVGPDAEMPLPVKELDA